MARKKKGQEQPEEPATPSMTAKGRYEKLVPERQPYLERAYACADLTIPSLFPRPGSTSATSFQTPFQGVGADGVNNIASKLMLALFPPGSAFFRLELDEGIIQQLREKSGGDEAGFENAKEEFEGALARIERQVMARLETKGARAPLFQMFELEVVTGNALLQNLDDGAFKTHKLSNYVCKRDHAGTPIEVIVLEELDKTTLPPLARAIYEAETAAHPEKMKDEETCELYTWIRRGDESWSISQEICGQLVPGTTGTYPLEKCPWLPQRFAAVSGEDYGRGFVELRLGALRSLETLEQAMVEGTAIMAKVLFGVDESGVTQKKSIVEAANGAVIDGNFEKDVTVLHVDKQADFSTALQLRNDIKKDLQRSFLLLQGVQRDAERVTAEEIRALVAELETAQGGFYTVASRELQYPIVVVSIAQMQTAGKLPHLPKGTVTPQIVTGLDGLGRSSDLGKLQTLLQILTTALGPQGVAAALDADNLATRLGSALAYDVKGLVKSSAQVQQETATAQQGELAKAAVGPAIKAASDHVMASKQGAQEGAPVTQ